MPVAIMPPSDLPLGSVPDWVHLLPAGEVRTTDARGPYRVGDPAALIATSLVGGKLVLDENHATDLASPRGESSPARGWIVALEHRADGIWGRVEWTGTGRQIMADRAYRGVSPVIVHDKAGTISTILRASLTNTPNLVGLASLHSQMPVNVASEGYAATLHPSGPSAGLEAADRDIILKLGVDPQAYAATRNPIDPNDGLNGADLEIIRKLGLDRAAYARTHRQESDNGSLGILNHG